MGTRATLITRSIRWFRCYSMPDRACWRVCKNRRGRFFRGMAVWCFDISAYSATTRAFVFFFLFLFASCAQGTPGPHATCMTATLLLTRQLVSHVCFRLSCLRNRMRCGAMRFDAVQSVRFNRCDAARTGGPRSGGPHPPSVRVLGGRPLPAAVLLEVHHHRLLAAVLARKDQVRTNTGGRARRSLKTIDATVPPGYGWFQGLTFQTTVVLFTGGLGPGV